jgi:hypothetical protein
MTRDSPPAGSHEARSALGPASPPPRGAGVFGEVQPSCHGSATRHGPCRESPARALKYRPSPRSTVISSWSIRSVNVALAEVSPCRPACRPQGGAGAEPAPLPGSMASSGCRISASCALPLEISFPRRQCRRTGPSLPKIERTGRERLSSARSRTSNDAASVLEEARQPVSGPRRAAPSPVSLGSLANGAPRRVRVTAALFAVFDRPMCRRMHRRPDEERSPRARLGPGQDRPHFLLLTRPDHARLRSAWARQQVVRTRAGSAPAPGRLHPRSAARRGRSNSSRLRSSRNTVRSPGRSPRNAGFQPLRGPTRFAHRRRSPDRTREVSRSMEVLRPASASRRIGSPSPRPRRAANREPPWERSHVGPMSAPARDGHGRGAMSARCSHRARSVASGMRSGSGDHGMASKVCCGPFFRKLAGWATGVGCVRRGPRRAR